MSIDKKVCVIGLGYIGLPTAVVLANFGYNVSGIDIKKNVVDLINLGEAHIEEPNLSNLLKKVVKNKKLKAFQEIKKSEIYIICVPTPLLKKGNLFSPEIKYILDSVDMISTVIKNGDIVILESTSPVGTTQIIFEKLIETNNTLKNIKVGYCPERVLPGNILYELSHNDRIVGGLTDDAKIDISNFYRTFITGTVYETNAETAEMCKLTENSFRDVNIAFANEISLLCRNLNIDELELIKLANKHPRVNILSPGIGVGGHCIAVDPYFIISQNPENSDLIKSGRKVNLKKTNWIIEDIKKKILIIQKNENKVINVCFLGMTYKPDIGDMRESPAIQIIDGLHLSNVNHLLVDPWVQNTDSINLYKIEDAVPKSDLVICLVKHSFFLKQGNLNLIIDSNYLDYCNLIEI
mgnify:CR=1 FL=1